MHDYMGTVKADGSIVSVETYYLQDPPTGDNTTHHIPYKMDFTGGYQNVLRKQKEQRHANFR